MLDRRTSCDCGSLLSVRLSKVTVDRSTFANRPFRVWRYKELIPVPKGARIVSMNEGGTPLIDADKIASRLGLGGLMVKLEGCNPTGSFKDRGLTVAATMALFHGAKALIAASTGNTASSMSAYARKASMVPIVVVPAGKVAGGKLGQLSLYGSLIIEVAGSFDEAMRLVIEYSRLYSDAYVVNSLNPWRIEGQKTIAYEIIEEYGVPDWIVVPVGNGGNIFSIWKGFNEFRELGLIDRLPRMLAVQALGASPILKAYETGVYEPIREPKTVASAIRIGNPVHWRRVLRVLRESEGAVVGVSDEEILEAHKEIAREEGLGVETSSATTLAGLRRAVEGKLVEKGETAVLIATGHALKEPEIIGGYEASVVKVSGPEELIKVVSNIRQLGPR